MVVYSENTVRMGFAVYTDRRKIKLVIHKISTHHPLWLVMKYYFKY